MKIGSTNIQINCVFDRAHFNFGFARSAVRYGWSLYFAWFVLNVWR